MSDEERLARRAAPGLVTYMVREVDYDSCSHLALVQGPPMEIGEARGMFARLFKEFETARKEADQAFRAAEGPWSGADDDDWHDRWRDWVRKAGCLTFSEFLQARGFCQPVQYVDVALHSEELHPREDMADDPDEPDGSDDQVARTG